MSILEIAHYPEACLRKKAEPITNFDDRLKNLIENMGKTMYHAPGIGLAGPQVRLLERVFVVDVSEDKSDFKAFINPEIIASDGSQVYEEGCLSLPHIYEKVTRSEYIKVRAQDVTGKEFELEAEGLLSVCIQHELDHLNGVLFYDHLSRLKQGRVIKKLDKQLKAKEA